MTAELNVADETPPESFAPHVRTTDRGAADALVGRLPNSQPARASDTASESGIFQD